MPKKYIKKHNAKTKNEEQMKKTKTNRFKNVEKCRTNAEKTQKM